MAKNYTKEDIKKVSYGEFWGWIKKLTSEVKKVTEKEKLEIDMIVPIMKSWMMPAQHLASVLKITTILPYQAKYEYKPIPVWKPLLTLSSYTASFKWNQRYTNPKWILIVDTNTVSWETARWIIQDIKKNYPDTPVIFATVVLSAFAWQKFPCPVVHYKKSMEWFDTEDRKEKIFVFPWENENENEVLLEINTFHDSIDFKKHPPFQNFC